MAESSRARRLRELVSHWRGHGKSPEPMPQHELPEPAKEGYRSCAFAYAAKRRLLLVRIKQVLNDAIYNDTYRSVQELATSLKPTSLIIDLSAVKKFDLPAFSQKGHLHHHGAFSCASQRVMCASRFEVSYEVIDCWPLHSPHLPPRGS